MVLPLIYLATNESPFKEFCRKNQIHQKTVIIALSLSDCAVCYTPPDELLTAIRTLNSDIPVWVVTNEDMAEGEKKIFRNKFGVHSNTVNFIFDRVTYHYMVAEKGGLPSVSCVSESGEILAFKHLKHDNMETFYRALKSDFEIFLVNKTEFRSNFISPKKHNGVYYLHNSVCLFHPGTNVISKYNLRGENIKNLSIDSLDIDYLQLARQIFPEKLYKSSKLDYNTNHPDRSRLIRSINVIKMPGDTLCALMNIIATGDTVINKKHRKYNQSFACMFLFDKDLTYLDTKYFSSSDEASSVNCYMRGACSDLKFYLGRYDSALKQDVMAEYELKNSTLILKKQFDVPKNAEINNKVPIFPSISMSLNNIYISYFDATDKGMVTAVKTYKLNKTTGDFSEEIYTDAYWAQMYSTQKGNYLLWTFEKDFTSQVKGYDKNTKKLIPGKEKPGIKSRNAEPLLFVIDGYLHEYAYLE